MVTLHAFGRVHPLVHGLTRDLRVEWALEELELPYRVHGVDHTGGETSRDEFRRISPFKQLPVIEDDGFGLAESGAILLYLAEKAGRLAAPKTRATVTRWCFAALTTIEPPVAMIVLTDFEKKSDDVTKERRATLVKWADRGLAGPETCLGEHANVTGAEFTVADILMTTVLRQARRAGLLATTLGARPTARSAKRAPRGLAPSPPTRRASVQNPAPSRERRSRHSSAPCR